MQIQFEKYQGNGNDFVLVDNRDNKTVLTSAKIRKLCDRHFGIGADGFILLNNSESFDFEMKYFNSDGNLASMCGNGGRCIAAFAFFNKITDGSELTFEAFDGIHKAKILSEINPGKVCDVSLEMTDVMDVQFNGKYYFLDTGSPHYIEFVDKVAEIDVVTEGRKTRYAEAFSPDGTNVNFVEITDDRIFIRTYERGVEDETLSCGTGVTASAIAAFLETGRKDFKIHTTGGDFRVDFEEKNGKFKSVWLNGPAEMVFKGSVCAD
jgi:diaminopimelate epimerase